MLAHPMSIDYSCTQLDPEELAEHHARLHAEHRAERRQLWERAQTAGNIERTRANAYYEQAPAERLGGAVRERQRTDSFQQPKPDPRKMRPRQTVRVRYWGGDS